MAGMIPFAIAPDTGGAVRGSAALCGSVGLKPSFGSIGCAGMVPAAESLDHCGIVAASVSDVATVFATVCAGNSPRALPLPVRTANMAKGLTIGILADLSGIQPCMASAVRDAAFKFENYGAVIEEIAVDWLDRLLVAGQVIYAAECFAIHSARLRDHVGMFGQNTRHRIVVGAFLDSSDYASAKRIAASLTQRFDESVMSRCDILLCPAAAGPAPLIEDSPYGIAGRSGAQTLLFNVTGHPAISVPGGMHQGLPLGLQLVGHRHDEDRLLQAAQMLTA